MKVRTALETIPLAPLPPDFDGQVAASFPEAELARLGGARARSVAGRLALKRAAASLVRELGGAAPPLAAIRVDGDGAGRPSIAVDPAGDPAAAALCARMRVSISHSRRTAAAAAAIGEEAP